MFLIRSRSILFILPTILFILSKILSILSKEFIEFALV